MIGEFRLHMSRHHLNRSWAVILQQAWSMYLKDHINTTPNHHGFGGQNKSWGQVRKKISFDYNKGNCTFGRKCRFDHRCSFCNKFGHGAYCCRKAGNKPHSEQSGNNGHDRWDKYEKDQVGKINNNLNDKAK